MAKTLARRPALREAFLTLDGPLGAGKTTFARHLLRALGIEGRIKSPSYALMEPYETNVETRPGGPPALLAITHFDFYRFADPREFVEAGLRDVFERPGLKLAEWPGRAGSLLPPADLRIEIEPIDEHRRDVTMTAFTAVGQELLP